MRHRIMGAVIAGAAIALACGIGTFGDEPQRPADDTFVVHEWGTFTSIGGADGLVLEGLSREEEALPDFVYSRTAVRDCPLRDRGWKGLEVPADHVTQKMETPVLYFHSASARRVRVRVDFVRGLISEWYPVSDLLGPPEGSRTDGPLDISKVERSFLQWDVDVLPRDAPAPAEVPETSVDDPWTYAREVDASWLRTRPRVGPDRAGPVEAERYLFYRGLGNFAMPLVATMDRDGEVVLRNSGPRPIETAVVFEIEGDRGRIQESGVVAPGATTRVSLGDGAAWGSVDDVERTLQALVARRLEAQGLHVDEARAMVRTWSRSWFRNEGTRALWFLPRADVDALLPLAIDPTPDTLVRVLVGRMEVIAPRVAAEVEAAIRNHGASDAVAAGASNARLERLGRFLEPHVRHVLARTQDDRVRANALAILAGLREPGTPR